MGKPCLNRTTSWSHRSQRTREAREPTSLTDAVQRALNLATNSYQHSGAFCVGRKVEGDRPPVRVEVTMTGSYQTATDEVTAEQLEKTCWPLRPSTPKCA